MDLSVGGRERASAHCEGSLWERREGALKMDWSEELAEW